MSGAKIIRIVSYCVAVSLLLASGAHAASPDYGELAPSVSKSSAADQYREYVPRSSGASKPTQRQLNALRARGEVGKELAASLQANSAQTSGSSRDKASKKSASPKDLASSPVTPSTSSVSSQIVDTAVGTKVGFLPIWLGLLGLLLASAALLLFRLRSQRTDDSSSDS